MSKSSLETPSTAPETKSAVIAQSAPTSAPEAPKSPKTAKKPSGWLVYAVSAALVLSVGSLALSAFDFFTGDTPITFNSGNDGNSITFTEGSIAEVATKVSPSVVSILTETRTSGYFGQSSTSTAAGSGFIVSSDGYVITNKHVVSDANNISVILDDGTTFSNVKVAATDPANDVAFLKVADASDLPAVTLGNSKSVSVGQQVIAIGNALGQYSNSVTAGIISGIGRTITATDSNYQNAETLTDMIQTDASINAGNSGGPLINAAGEVIGINTAVSDGNGIGFAIPISSVKGMLSTLLDTGNAKRAYLGVYYTPITAEVAEQYNLPVTSGAYVHSQNGTGGVVLGGPASVAGVLDGDIITSINGAKVGQAGSVASLIGEYAPGDTVQLGILRGDKEMAVNVKLGEYQD